MVITEIFKSIQGEGTRAGLPCIFVRVTGCNLRCTWCDTAYAFHGGEKKSVEGDFSRGGEVAGRCEGMLGARRSFPLGEVSRGGRFFSGESFFPAAELIYPQEF